MPEATDIPSSDEKLFAFEQPGALKKGATLFKKPCIFLMGATSPSNLPEADRVEVAFVGRSNVGKSSLINALTNNRNIARTSNTPGRTQEINFFDLGDDIRLADLPGYGYAEAPKKKVIAWQSLIKQYLKGRPNLRRVFILIDSRHGVKALDKEIFEMLDKSAVSYQVVLTKGDKIKVAELEKTHQKTVETVKKFVAAHPYVHQTSAIKKEGLGEIKAEIAALD